MANTGVEFERQGFDKVQYDTYFAKNQAEYIRKRLRIIFLYHQDFSVASIAILLSIHKKTVDTHIRSYLSGGFELLCKKIKRPKESKLTQHQQLLFKEVLLNKKPHDMGLLGNMWTGELMCQYLEKSFGVHYRTGIYDLLERLNLTHQRAHADYGNANIAQQQAFVEELESIVCQADEHTAVVFFDEFSVCERPTAFYGWAEKNTRPTFVTNEKKETEQTRS